MALRHGVALVRHADARQAIGRRVVERVLDDAVDALVGVDLFLNRDFILGARLEPPADVHVDAFRVFAEDDEVHIVWAALLERTQPLVEESDGTLIHVQIELKADAEEDVARVAHVGNARIAERADVDRVELVAQPRVAVRRQADARLQIIVGAVRQHLEIQLASEHLAHRTNHLHGLGGHVDADAVARNHRYSHLVIG